MRQDCADNYALIACQDFIFLPKTPHLNKFTYTEGRFWTHSFWTVIMFAILVQVKYQSCVTM